MKSKSFEQPPAPSSKNSTLRSVRSAPNSLFPAKVTPPQVEDTVERTRLFDELDHCAHRSITWIAAPAGAGKTTIAASYLDARSTSVVWYSCDEGDADLASFFYYMREAARRAMGRRAAPLPLLRPEYVADIQMFARRFFERLSRQLLTSAPEGQQAAIVFDNFQDVPPSAALHTILAGSLDGLCDGVRVIIISREEPPIVLARLVASGRIALVNAEHIRFTLEETRNLVARRHSDIAATALEHIYELTQGWAAGITLLLESDNLRSLPGAETADMDSVMGFFAEEVFTHLEADVRQFLLETARLPTVSVPLANQLTGGDSALRILGLLCRRNLFTRRLDNAGLEYQYHPLLRKFLLTKAHTLYSPDVICSLRSRTARLLEDANQVEDAARLYAEAGDSAALARMVNDHAAALLAQGRVRTLAGWLQSIQNESANDPWVRYWHGMCVFASDLQAACRSLEFALDRFAAEGNRKGVYRAWAGLVDAYSFGLDDWRPLDKCLALFEELQAADPVFPDRETELIVVSRLLAALTAVRVDQPDLLERWNARMLVLLEDPTPIEIRIDAVFAMSIYHLWRGAYNKNGIQMEKVQAELKLHPVQGFSATRVKLMVAVHSWITGQYEAAYRAVSEGLRLSDESGIHAFDSLLWSFRAAADLAQGHLDQGAEAIAHQLAALVGPERTLDVYFYHVNAAWHALLSGNPARAHEHLQMVGNKVNRIGDLYYQALWRLGMAQTVFLLDRPEEALEHQRVARELAVAMDSWVMQWYAMGVEAWILLQRGRETEGLLALHRALILGRRHGYIHLELFLHDVMRFLLTKALEEQIEPEYVRAMIRTVGLTLPLRCPDRALALSSLLHWPFRVRIFTLGRFEVQIQDQPLSFSAKEKKKPLDMLKALIALGGVDVSEEQLADLLWPNADGDLAHKSLETTLSRLRRLLGTESSIVYRSRRITINPEECWVDCLVLEQLMEPLETMPAARSAPLVRRALALVNGSFLAGDNSMECFVRYRDLVRGKFLSALMLLGRTSEKAGDWTRAIEYYQRGLTSDPLAEEFYFRLMVCQRQLGNHSGAMRTYMRCEQNLRTGLRIAPSPDTRALYHSLGQLGPSRTGAAVLSFSKPFGGLHGNLEDAEKWQASSARQKQPDDESA